MAGADVDEGDVEDFGLGGLGGGVFVGADAVGPLFELEDSELDGAVELGPFLPGVGGVFDGV